MGYPRLTTKQAEALRDLIRPMLDFLHKCRRRLDARGFDPNGPIYQAIDKAYCAVHSLHVTLHYESCSHGVARADEKHTEPESRTDQVHEPPKGAGA
jgi:hypothetical protein